MVRPSSAPHPSGIRMSIAYSWVVGSRCWGRSAPTGQAGGFGEAARCYDRRHPRLQSQAALLLVMDASRAAEVIRSAATFGSGWRYFTP